MWLAFVDLPKLEMGSSQDSHVRWRPEAAEEPFRAFSSPTFSLLSTAWKLQNAGVQEHTRNSFEGLVFSSSKTNEGKQRKFVFM